MERTYSRHLKEGSKVLAKGWVAQVRDLGGVKFFLLRDREGSVQVTAKKGSVPDSMLKQVLQLGREDCVSVKGEVKQSKQAPGGMEIVPEKIQVMSKAAQPLPIETSDKIETGFDKRFDYRFIDLRNPKVQAVFRVRDVVLTKMREFFEGDGFVEVNTPVIQAAGAEGGSTLFPLIYYKSEAFLRQSPQLYKQILMSSGLDRVYEIGPAFRAEKFHTRRHVSEFVSVDFEMAWIESQEEIWNILERMAEHVFKGVIKDCKPEIKLFNAKVSVPELPMKRISYDDAIEMVSKAGKSVKWGDDFMDAEERVLGEIMAKKGHEWYFVTRFPSKIKPFYIMADGKWSHSYDMIYRGMEMSSGGQREHRPDVLVRVFKEKGLEPEKFKFYVDAFRFGMPAHGGCGFGVERLVQQMLGLDNIKEVILFPRTPERLVP
jgi:aspartyl-tRNA synthetase